MLYNPIDDAMCWWFDESVKVWLAAYYWPTFVMGNIDEWMKLGITLNGIRPMCASSK